ncbi:MAG: bifunctional diguanylate cyclase/phosphodiesterase [Sulfurovaceae bacterium]|nr:bifunctional diguanylate cyclase/phosphodiesterase [Sulfurovaceae bacterium]
MKFLTLMASAVTIFAKFPQRKDYLTKLANKNRLLVDLKSAKRPILFYLNIDDFMKLNEFYGADMGDKVLIRMAQILTEIAKELNYKVYRIYNDEFMLYCEEKEKNALCYKENLKGLIYQIEESSLNCIEPDCIGFTVSGGIASYQNDDKFENLILNASYARRMAKSEQKKFVSYENSMEDSEEYAKNILCIKQIKLAIMKDNIIPYFQPIVDNQTGKIIKYEALVRMIDNGVIISPFFFLEVAKKAKLYSKITRIILDKTLDIFINFPKYECSINLSIEDILNEETLNYIYSKLESYPHSSKIVFEITETTEITDFKVVMNFIKKVRSFGVKISIDDFGTGYANFEYILNLDVDYIKIDGSLIKYIDVDEESRILTEAIIAFSKKLGTKTIVEFVHSQKVYDEVVALGADYSQGYFIGKPEPFILND